MTDAYCVPAGDSSSEPISFLFPYHDEQGLLTEALESLRPELLPGDEVLVYDDASTWAPGPFVPEDLPVRVLQGAGRGEAGCIGPGPARNALLSEARHSWVHFHDSDDLFAPGWRRAVSRYLSTPAELVLTEVRTFGLTAQDRILGLRPFSNRGEFVRWAIAGAILPAAGSYRKSLLEKTGGYRPELWQSEDAELGVRVALGAARIGVVPESLALLRNRASSRSKDAREVLRHGVAALELLLPGLPPEFARDVADRASTLGMLLIGLDDEEGARGAWELVSRSGGASLAGRSWLMRVGARLLGLPLAERVSLHVRRLRSRAPARLQKE